MTTSAFQTLGDVDGLIAIGEQHPAFVYPEFAQVTPLLSNGLTERNYVLQSSGQIVRESARSWTNVSTADKEALLGYALSKEQVAYTEEDGTTRTVIVLDFVANERWHDLWEVRARLIETEEPTVGS